MEPAVTGDQWQAQVERSRRDDAVGHVRNNISWNVLKCVGYSSIYGRDDQP